MVSDKTVIILRGVSGSGKSSLAKLLESLSWSVLTVSADNYFYKDGVYNFDSSKLQEAHDRCFTQFNEAVEQEMPVIVVDNTNTKESEFQRYIDKANEVGYNVISMVVENRHGNKDVHGVPDQTKLRQAVNIRNSLKL